jgi:uncharacterized protein YraI
MKAQTDRCGTFRTFCDASLRLPEGDLLIERFGAILVRRSKMKRLLFLVVFVLLHAATATAQTAIVTRNVNLRADPSTENSPVVALKPGAQLELLDPNASNGFLHVKTQEGKEGWAWSRNVRIQAPGTASTATTTLSTTAANTQHVGPDRLYPTPSMTPGKPDTLILDDLTKTYTEHCPASKATCTYSQSHRDVNTALHKQIYDEYNVPQAGRNIKTGEVDHFYPLCAGGSNDKQNLWYQPAANDWNGKDFGYHAKDKLETYICVQIKAGKLQPQEAYDRMTGDWVKFYMDEGLDDED